MSGFGLSTPTETCMHCGGTGGHVVQHDMHPRADTGIIPLRSEWVGCVACGQTGRIMPEAKAFLTATLGGVPFPAEPVHIPTRKQVAPGGSR